MIKLINILALFINILVLTTTQLGTNNPQLIYIFILVLLLLLCCEVADILYTLILCIIPFFTKSDDNFGFKAVAFDYLKNLDPYRTIFSITIGLILTSYLTNNTFVAELLLKLQAL